MKHPKHLSTNSKPIERRFFIAGAGALAVFGVTAAADPDGHAWGLRRQADGSTPMPTETPTATPTATPTEPALTTETGTVVRPSGSGIVEYESIPWQGNFPATVNYLSSPQQVSFLPGTFEFANFDANNYGSLFWTNVAGVRGSGIDKTVFQMAPWSSTKAGLIPSQSAGGTNPLHLCRSGAQDTTQSKSPIHTGFTLRGTDQGHLYNGWMLYCATNARFEDVKFEGIPGNHSANPGETFSLNIFRSPSTALVNVEMDGRNAAGQRVAASLLGLNQTKDMTVTDCNFHDAQYGYGATCWNGSGTITYTRVKSNYNMLPFNFEQCGGAIVNFNQCDFRFCRATVPGTSEPVHMIVDADNGSAKVTITDPVYDGPKFTVCRHTTYPYNSGPNTQLASDINLVVNGVSRPDLLRVVSDYSA